MFRVVRTQVIVKMCANVMQAEPEGLPSNKGIGSTHGLHYQQEQ
jgi:hypothetical protein